MPTNTQKVCLKNLKRRTTCKICVRVDYKGTGITWTEMAEGRVSGNFSSGVEFLDSVTNIS